MCGSHAREHCGLSQSKLARADPSLPFVLFAMQRLMTILTSMSLAECSGKRILAHVLGNIHACAIFATLPAKSLSLQLQCEIMRIADRCSTSHS